MIADVEETFESESAASACIGKMKLVLQNKMKEVN